MKKGDFVYSAPLQQMVLIVTASLSEDIVIIARGLSDSGGIDFSIVSSKSLVQVGELHPGLSKLRDLL